MKIIQARNMSWEAIINCGGCGSKLEIETSDLKYCSFRKESIWGAHEDWFDDRYYTKCAVCKIKLWVSGIPAHIEQFIKNGT